MKKIMFALPVIAVVSGCSTFGGSDDAGQGFVKARNQHYVQTKVIKEYVPVPMPGQLMPVPDNASLSNKNTSSKYGSISTDPQVFLSKEKAVEYANKNAQQYPDQNDFFNAMMTYNYMPGAVYTIYTAPLKITDIVMEPGEKLISQAAGDTLRWQIAQTYSGEGQDLRQHILVKPNKPDLENTLLITTNKRTYHLILKSSESSAYMVSVKWDYPKNMVYVYNGDTQGNAGFNSSPGYNMDLSTLNFNYKVSMYEGKKIPDWYPQRVFSNGRQTFIEFSKSFQSSDLPILVVKRDDGTDATMVNWRLRGKFMIVDSVLQNAFLQTGVDKTGKTMVEIAQVGKQS